MAEFDPYLQWLGIRDPQRPPNHYRLLGLELFESNEAVIANAADRQMAHVRTFQSGPHGELSQRVLNELAAARVCLLKPDKKTAYDQQLRAKTTAARPAAQTPKPVPVAAAASPKPVATATATASRPAAAHPVATRPSQPAPESPFAEIASAAASTHTSPRRKRKQQKSLAPYAFAAVVLLAIATFGLFAMKAGQKPQVASNRPTPKAEVKPATTDPAATNEKPNQEGDKPSTQPGVEPETTAQNDEEKGGTTKPHSPVIEDTETPGEEVATNDTGPLELPADTSVDEPEQEIPTDASETASETPGESDPEDEPVADELPHIGPQPLDSKLLAIPTEEDRKAALGRIRDIFGKDLDEARTAEAKQKLANTLLEQATATKDDVAAQFVLLDLVKDLAVTAGDVDLANRVIDLQSERFAIDPLATKHVALIQINRQARNADARAALVPAANGLVDVALEREDFAQALKFNQFVQQAATKARDRETMKSTLARDKSIKEMQKQQEAAIAALEKVKADASNAQANFELGAYLCFVKQDWEHGLLRLSKSNHPLLQDAALQELAKPTEATKQKQLADLWLRCAELSELAEWADGLQARAQERYQQSVDGLSGLDKAEVEKKLKRWADNQSQQLLGKELELKLLDNVSMRFRKIPSGKFIMGSPVNELGRESDEVQHVVTLTKSFCLGVTEVTQSQWQAVMGDNPSSQQGESLPVQNVTWPSAMRFCEALNRSPLGSKFRFRLPSEAEWEFACRAGTQTAFFFGNDPRVVGEFGWCEQNSPRSIMPVAKLRPNQWGLYDMAGNVCEWTSDWLGPYSDSPQTDPKGAVAGTIRAHRGSSSWHAVKYLRSAERGGNPPDEIKAYLGLRIACDPL